MSQDQNNESGNPPPPPPADAPSNPTPSPVPLGARVSDRVAGGSFAMGAIVLEGPHEFLLDFVQSLTRPPRVVSRVVVPHPVLGQFIDAMVDNLGKFQASFGEPKSMPTPPRPQRKLSLQEIYDDLKLPEEIAGAVYANAVMIGHSPAEFFMDFIHRTLPYASVTSRVYVSASQIPRMIETLRGAYDQHLNRRRAGDGML